MKIIVYLKDVFFLAKISEVARQTGKEVKFIDNEEDLLNSLDDSKLVIIDLESDNAVETLKEIKKLKDVQIIGYCSHVNEELRERARPYCIVLAKSEFSQRLPDILKL